MAGIALATKLADFPFKKGEAALLTPAAKTTTLSMLIDLRGFADTEHGKSTDDVINDFDKKTGLKLTIDDIRSANEALVSYMTQGPVNVTGDACCCCTCTPCCSCCA